MERHIQELAGSLRSRRGGAGCFGFSYRRAAGRKALIDEKRPHTGPEYPRIDSSLGISYRLAYSSIYIQARHPERTSPHAYEWY